MPALKLKEGLYSVGVLNPNLRVFDIVMRTEYGTSYNSFLIKGEKNALVETCHKTFFEEYIENITSVIPTEEIDYIILNHVEPDHSGALKELKKRCPKAQIVCSRAAAVYLRKITNDPDFQAIIVKDGDAISLGNIELKFFAAPFLHWPDTIFTYAPELNTVLTCDFLGSHYCEPNMLDHRVNYQTKFLNGVKGYFDAIFSPFKPYARSGLEKLDGLDFDMACVSHGPVLTQKGFLPKILSLYRKWSAEEKRAEPLIPIFYTSAYGYTKQLAEAAQKLIKEKLPAAQTEAYDIIEHDMGMLASLMNNSDGFMIGSPTINKDAVPPVWELLSRLDGISAQKKPVGVFGSYGWSGEAIQAVSARLSAIRVKVVGEGFKANFCPSAEELDGMRGYTELFLNSIPLK